MDLKLSGLDFYRLLFSRYNGTVDASVPKLGVASKYVN